MNWNGSLIDFGSNISYTCKHGMKFEEDFDLDKVEATCRPGNTWEEPAWLKCVESKW